MSTTWATSVCTGSIYLAAAGIRDGQEATTHRARGNSWNDGARYTEQRVVEYGKVITAAGVPADIDTAFTLLARRHGPQPTQMVRLGIEYDPQPPFDATSRPKHLAELGQPVPMWAWIARSKTGENEHDRRAGQRNADRPMADAEHRAGLQHHRPG